MRVSSKGEVELRRLISVAASDSLLPQIHCDRSCQHKGLKTHRDREDSLQHREAADR